MYNVLSFYLTEQRENQNGSSEKMLQNKIMEALMTLLGVEMEF